VDIKWINGRYNEDIRIFDTSWEVEEWVDSLYTDFAGEGFVNVGYATPDEKVANHLAFRLPQWLEYARTWNPFLPRLTIRTETTTNSDSTPIYKVWTISIAE
jgi:hypothetical protein